MNTMCAAGTGSFLDQQAHRLGYSIEAFSRLALKSTTPPRIAGRCSVFAKTDMIHLQQGATPDFEIIAGLCLAMALYRRVILPRGRSSSRRWLSRVVWPITWGCARPSGPSLGSTEADLIIPPHFGVLGAIGAVLDRPGAAPRQLHPRPGTPGALPGPGTGAGPPPAGFDTPGAPGTGK